MPDDMSRYHDEPMIDDDEGGVNSSTIPSTMQFTSYTDDHAISKNKMTNAAAYTKSVIDDDNSANNNNNNNNRIDKSDHV